MCGQKPYSVRKSSGLKNIRIHRMRVERSRIPKEKVADSKISLWTEPETANSMANSMEILCRYCNDM